MPLSLPISGSPPWGPCHVCAAVCRLISAAAPPRFLEGPPAGRRHLGGAESRRHGALTLPLTGRSGQGMRVLCLVGRSGPDGATSRICGGLFPVSARGGSRPWGLPQTSHEGAAEGIEVLLHKGSVRCLGFRLSADGGQQLSAQRQRPDLVDGKNGAQVSRIGGLRCSLVLGDGLQLLSAVHVEPQRRRPVLGVRPAALSLPPEAVEGLPRVPAAGFNRHDGRQGVWGSFWGRALGPSGRAALAGSMELTASRFQWQSCGCGMIRTW